MQAAFRHALTRTCRPRCRLYQERCSGSAGQVCAADDIQELRSGTGVGAKISEQLTRDHRHAKFMDATSRHTVMHAFYHHANALGLEHVLDTVGDLRGHAFLYLQAFGEGFDDPCQLADADHFPIGQIADMNFADDWSHVVFAMRFETDVAQDDHLIVTIDFVERAPQLLHRVFRSEERR